MPKEVITEYWVEGCPLADECSETAWKRARVRSRTSADECRQWLRQHIANSSLHWQNRTSKEIDDIVANTKVEAGTCEVESDEPPRRHKQEQQQQKQPRDKRPRSPSRPPKEHHAKRSRGLKSPEPSAAEQEEFPIQQVAQVVAGLVAEHIESHLIQSKQELQQKSAPQTPPGLVPGSASSASGGSLVMVPWTKQDDLVTMTRGQLQKVKDSLERTQRAASQCCSYFRAGAAAFDEEAKLIKESLLAVDDVLVKSAIFRTQP